MAREAKHALIFVAILGLVFGGLLWKHMKSPGAALHLFTQSEPKTAESAGLFPLRYRRSRHWLLRTAKMIDRRNWPLPISSEPIAIHQPERTTKIVRRPPLEVPTTFVPKVPR